MARPPTHISFHRTQSIIYTVTKENSLVKYT